MNRFEKESRLHINTFASVLPIVAFVILMVLFLYGVGNVSETAQEKQKESLETALSRSIVQCYAVEGKYPSSVEYLEEHYGITYDKNVFLVDYDSYGDNLFPEVTVIRKLQ